MRLIRFVVIVVAIFGCIESVYSNVRSDSLFIRPFSSKISARALIGIKEFSIEFNNSSKLRSSNPDVTYKPNNGLVGGIGISYRNTLISYYFKIPGSESSKREFGNTNISDFQVNLTTRFFYFSLFNRTYTGFYLSNPSNSYSEWREGMPLPQRSDIISDALGAEAIVNLNPRRYSLNASLKLTEQQIRSSFAGLIYANYTLSDVEGDSTLIPSQVKVTYFEGDELIKANITGWTVMPGISYVFVRGRWFFNPIFFTGIGYAVKELHFVNNSSEDYHDYYIRINARLNCGFNGNNIFGGVHAEWNKMFYPEEDFIIKTENLNVMLMFGIRF